MRSSRTPPGALREPSRRSCGAPEHIQEIPERLQDDHVELPNTSKSSPGDSQDRISSSRTPSRNSPAASKDRVSSSRTPRGALKQPPRTESRAPEHLEELSSSLQGTNFELPSKQARKKASKAKESKQANSRASKQANKRANEQTRKRANEQASTRPNELFIIIIIGQRLQD